MKLVLDAWRRVGGEGRVKALLGVAEEIWICVLITLHRIHHNCPVLGSCYGDTEGPPEEMGS